jgi:hypothetical protein
MYIFNITLYGASLIFFIIGYFKLKRALKKLLEKLEENIDDETWSEDERHLVHQTRTWLIFMFIGSVLSMAAIILSFIRKWF